MTDERNVDLELAIQDRVLVEAELYGRPVMFRAMIVKVCPDELWLGLASPDRRLETMRQDQTISLTIARPGAALLGKSGFLRPLGGSKSRIFAVVRPGALERVQRRVHIRYQMNLPIIFRHMDAATREPLGKGVVATTVNVSPGGLLLKGQLPVALGEELAFTLPLAGQDRIAMLGVVARIRSAEEETPGATTDASDAEVAIKFTRITTVDQERMMRFILMKVHRERELALQQPAAPVARPVVAALPTPTAVQGGPTALASNAPRPAAPPANSVPAPAVPSRPHVPPPVDKSQPLIAVGLQLCEGGQAQEVRLWFDSLMPGSRIELLCLLQTNMAGSPVPGAVEPASVRPLAVALGLLAA